MSLFRDKKSRTKSASDRHIVSTVGQSPSHPLDKFVVEEIELQGDVRGATGARTASRGRPSKPPLAWLPTAQALTGWIALWLALVVAALFSRHLWPPDETRVTAIAWEMWARGDFLVPVFNGVFAPDASPLLSWSMQAGWAVFGANAWWPRLVPALFALASALLCMPLARFLWPGRADVARFAPGILLGGFFWALFSTLTHALMLVTFFTLLSHYALVWTWRKRDLRVWLLLGLALGLGALVQGWLILLYVLPVALLAPLWANEGPKPRWDYWYADIIKAVIMGLGIYLVWWVPLAMRLGVRDALGTLSAPLSAQSVEWFAQASPGWWYLFLLPLLGLPWFAWPLTWLRLWHMRRMRLNAGLLFCMSWAVPVVGLLSLFSLRQPQLLLPLIPAFTLAVAFLLLDDELSAHAHDTLASAMIFPVILLGGGLAVVPGLPRVEFLPEALWNLSPFVGIAVTLVGIMLAWLPLPGIRRRVANIATLAVGLSGLVCVGIGWQYDSLFAAGDVATVLADSERAGRPLALVGGYAGEFTLAARLHQPLQTVDKDAVVAWLGEHPQGLVVTFTDVWQPAAALRLKLAYEVPYRNNAVRLWEIAPPPAPEGSPAPASPPPSS